MAKPAKPTYIGLLNAIAIGETSAEGYLLAWADTTKDKRLATTLRFVAMREGEHGKAFAKRMLELGFEVRWPESTDRADQAMAMATSDKSDIIKFRAFKLHRAPGKTDVFDAMFTDKNIDPVTGGLLGRYIAEERDSGRRLAAEYDRLIAKQSKAKQAKIKQAKQKRRAA